MDATDAKRPEHTQEPWYFYDGGLKAATGSIVGVGCASNQNLAQAFTQATMRRALAYEVTPPPSYPTCPTICPLPSLSGVQ